MTSLNGLKTLVCFMALAAFAVGAASLRAEPAKTEPAKTEPAKADAGKPAQGAAQPGHEGHDHAGHNHGATGSMGVGTAPGAVKPGAAGTVRPPDVPAPTVTNKPGEIPKVSFDTPTYDFGRVKAGDEIRKDFWFTNAGNGLLEVLKVRPACGCTTAGEHDKVVEPGKTGKIPIKLGTTNMAGPITKTVTVYTNCSGPEEMITLNIKGEVWQPVQLAPPSASFGRLTTAQVQDGSQTRKVTISNNTDKPAKLSIKESSNPAFKAEIVEVETGKKFDLNVTAQGALTSGMVSAMLTVETGLEEVPSVTVPVSAYITAEVEVAPNRLSLPMNRTAPLQRHLYINNNNANKPLKISDVATSNPALKHTLTEVKPGTSFRITLDIPADYKIASTGDTVTFKTDNATVPTVTVPITEMNYGQSRDLSAAVGTRPGTVSSKSPNANAAPVGSAKAAPGATTTTPPQPAANPGNGNSKE